MQIRKIKFVKYDYRIIDSARQNKRICNDYYGTVTVKGSGYYRKFF